MSRAERNQYAWWHLDLLLDQSKLCPSHPSQQWITCYWLSWYVSPTYKCQKLRIVPPIHPFDFYYAQTTFLLSMTAWFAGLLYAAFCVNLIGFLIIINCHHTLHNQDKDSLLCHLKLLTNIYSICSLLMLFFHFYTGFYMNFYFFVLFFLIWSEWNDVYKASCAYCGCVKYK